MPVFFVLGLLVLFFLWGFIAGTTPLFPHRIISDARDSARGIWEAYLRPPPFDRPARPGYPPQGGAIMHDAARTAPGVTFITGYTPNGFAGWLVDAAGRKLHEWHATFSQVFGDKAPQLLYQARDLTIAWHGAHLFPNGDILFNFQDNSFPFGSGLVKLDKNSNVIWKLAVNTHHDVTVMDDGTIWVPSQRYRPEGLPEFPALEPWFYEDVILEVSPDGKIRREISALKALADNKGLLNITYSEEHTITTQDPLHLNNVEPLPASMAAAFPMFKPDDLLVSFRNINTIAVIDPATKKVKWTMTGPFARQHDPDFLPNGHLMVYDNLGGPTACGGTRILEIDPATRTIVWQYDGCATQPFFGETRGEQEVLENGNVLTYEPQGGRVLEVTHGANPQIVWEYFNVLDPADGGKRVGLVTHAERFRQENLTFLSPIQP